MDITANKFFILATNKSSNVKPKLLCHRGTFFRRLKKYQVDNVIPVDTDYGLKVGAPQMIKTEDLPKLNDGLKNYKGYAEKNYDLPTAILSVSEKDKQVRGDYGKSKIQCASTIQLYQMLSTDCEDGIHLIKDRNVNPKYQRRQMASISVRNLASHIAAI